MNRDFLLASACEQARAIARGELDAQQLLAAQYAAIEQRNPALHAFIGVLYAVNKLSGGRDAG